MLTAKGLPTPNLSSGQHTPHSPLEWACLDEMIQAAEVLVEIVQVWSEKGSALNAVRRKPRKLGQCGTSPVTIGDALKIDLWWLR